MRETEAQEAIPGHEAIIPVHDCITDHSDNSGTCRRLPPLDVIFLPNKL